LKIRLRMIFNFDEPTFTRMTGNHNGPFGLVDQRREISEVTINLLFLLRDWIADRRGEGFCPRSH
jgi:hypothetical protein